MNHSLLGGGRAMGAEWKSDMYTREGLKNVNLLSHSLQKGKETTTALAATFIRGGSDNIVNKKSSQSLSFSTLGFSGSARQQTMMNTNSALSATVSAATAGKQD